MVRAGLRLYHFVEGDETDIERYRENNQIALESPDAALIDLFGNTEKGPEVIKGDDQLDKIEDIKHHLETVQTASPVPLTLIGYGHELNRDILEQKLESYEEALPFVNEWLELQIIIPLLETEWLLKGLWPGAIEYEIVWAGEEKKQAAKEVKRVEAAKGKAEAAKAIAEAGQKLLSLGWQESAVAEIMADMLNELGLEIDPKQLLKINQTDQLAMVAQQRVPLGSNGHVPPGNGQPAQPIITIRR
jgi:hypothetical protein